MNNDQYSESNFGVMNEIIVQLADNYSQTQQCNYCKTRIFVPNYGRRFSHHSHN